MLLPDTMPAARSVRRFLAGLALATASATAAAAPSAEPDACRKALEAAKTQAGFAARYEASIRKSGSDPFDQKGTAVRQGDLFYREGRREEEKEPSIKIFRRGERVAVFDARTEQWIRGEDAGDLTLGKGLEDPDEAMAFLLEAMDGAKAGTGTEKAGGVDCRPHELTLNKQKLAKKVREQYEAAKDLDWEKAEVNAQVLLGGDPVLPRLFRINGVMPDRNAGGGNVTIHIEVQVERYGEAPPPTLPKDVRVILGIR
jgi:hypothetical protein